jgi:hypothetical protein
MCRAVALAVLFAVSAAAPAYAQEQPAPPPPTLPVDATIAGLPMGGLDRPAARAELERQLPVMYERPITVAVRSRRRQVSTERLGQRIRYSKMLDTAFELAGRGERVEVPLRRTFSSRRLTIAIREIARPWYRAPRNARAILGIRRIARIRAHWGRELRSLRLRRDLVDELWRPTRARTVHGHLRRIRPAIDGRALRRI